MGTRHEDAQSFSKALRALGCHRRPRPSSLPATAADSRYVSRSSHGYRSLSPSKSCRVLLACRCALCVYTRLEAQRGFVRLQHFDGTKTVPSAAKRGRSKIRHRARLAALKNRVPRTWLTSA